ncbi:Uncharacterised protein [uncultured Ruminococcus sp.]|jgi:hypothetical protein|nr:hypothetical protein [uncultured Ruminococcus sp.]SCJ15346.1 Uncharacterised protein [uncultured Ruminococcus sp.]
MGFLYLIFGICAIAVSIGKALAVNFGISKYLSKKPYEGDYNFKKVVLYTLGTNYILLSAIVLFILGTIVCSIYKYLNLGQLLSAFFPGFAMALFGPKYDTIGDEYDMCSELVIPFFILVILSIPMLFLINYKFVYKDFEVSKNKKMKLSFFTALANAPYELLIPYGQIASMIIDRMMF